MDERTRRLQGVLDALLNKSVIKTIKRGSKTVLEVVWMVVGRLDSHVGLSFLFLSSAMVQLTIILQHPNAVSGLDAITRDEGAQYWIVALMMVMGWAIANWRSPALLTAGALMWVFYSAALLSGTLSGLIDARGLLAAIYTISSAFFAIRASYAQYQLEIERKRRENALSQLLALKAVANRGTASRAA